VLNYQYDEDGNLTSITDSQGGQTTLVWDGGLLVSKAYQVAHTLLRVDFSYDEDGNLLSATRYSDVAGTQLVGKAVCAYDANLVTSIVQTDGGGATLASYGYSYDTAGRLTSETDNGAQVSYSYHATPGSFDLPPGPANA
jgi:YD repeat-containing protein